MRFVFLILIITASACYAQQDEYQARLSKRLNQIKQLRMFDNSVVVYDESTAYGSNFPKWESRTDYYEGDHVLFERKMYKAIVYSVGRKPNVSKKDWQLMIDFRPYLFLRDTAKIEDLKMLLKDNHPYIRIYSFAALAYRKRDLLFQYVVDNLSDSTRIEQLTGHVGSELYPADLMISYSIGRFNKVQKDSLKNLVLNNYNYLVTRDFK